VINQAPRHEDVWRSRGIAPCILNLCSRQRWVANFTFRPFYHRGNSPRYPLARSLYGPQSRSGRCGDEEKMYAPGGNEPRLLKRPVRSLVNMTLSYPSSSVLLQNCKELEAWMLQEYTWHNRKGYPDWGDSVAHICAWARGLPSTSRVWKLILLIACTLHRCQEVSFQSANTSHYFNGPKS
jgi:hypothetical protein